MANLLTDPNLWSEDGATPPASWNPDMQAYEQVDAPVTVSFHLTLVAPAGDIAPIDVVAGRITSAPELATTFVNAVVDGEVVDSHALTDTDGKLTTDFAFDAVEGMQIMHAQTATDTTPYTAAAGEDFIWQVYGVAQTDVLVARDDEASTPYETTVTVDELANDTFNDGVPTPADVDITIETPPSNGTVSINANGTIDYTPNAGFSGQDTFVYRLTTPEPLECVQVSFLACSTEVVTSISTLPPWWTDLDPFSISGDGWTGDYQWVEAESRYEQVSSTGTPPTGDFQGEGMISQGADEVCVEFFSSCA